MINAISAYKVQTLAQPNRQEISFGIKGEPLPGRSVRLSKNPRVLKSPWMRKIVLRALAVSALLTGGVALAISLLPVKF